MKVLIGVPTRGRISLGTTEFLAKQTCDIYYATSAISVVCARQKIAAHFMKHDYDALLFLDDDVAPPHDAIKTLLSAAQPLVSANYPIYKNGQIKSAAYMSDEGDVYQAWTQLLLDKVHLHRVDGVGLGCCLIKKEVFKKLGISFKIHYADDEITTSEDIDFCNRARKAGFEIYYDFDCICDHYKNVSIRTIWNKYCV